jgi:hypothetical protein
MFIVERSGIIYFAHLGVPGWDHYPVRLTIRARNRGGEAGARRSACYASGMADRGSIERQAEALSEDLNPPPYAVTKLVKLAITVLLDIRDLLERARH